MTKRALKSLAHNQPNEILVLGCGVMGSQASVLLCKAGFSVRVATKDCIAAERKIRRAQKILQAPNAVPRLQAIEELFSVHLDGIDLVLECLPEDLRLKRSVLSGLKLDDSISICSNSSSYLPSEVHSKAHGLHFFNPISIPFIETYPCKDSSETSHRNYSSVVQILRKFGYRSVVALPARRGYFINRYMFAIIADYIELAGDSEGQAAFLEMLHATGFNINPERLIEMVGEELTAAIIENIFR
jgi:3-hydroxybutyryl-CoA dehydrogenase